MRNSMFFIVIVAICGSSFSFSKPNCDSTETKVLNGDTISTETSCYPDGGWKTLRLRNGNLHGKIEIFYANGSKAQVDNYVNGKHEGVKQGWTEDGFLSVYKPYRNGLPVDTHKICFDNKKQESIIIYDSTGNKNGWCRNWYESGALKDSTLFSHGDKLEEYLFFDSGKLRFSSHMKPDGYILTAESFDLKGKRIGSISKGSGKVILVNDDQTRDTLTVKDGKVQDESYEYFKNR